MENQFNFTDMVVPCNVFVVYLEGQGHGDVA